MKTFKNFILNEMPINNFSLLGNWNDNAPKRGYNAKDIGILTSQKGVEKIKNQWFRTEENFDFYFVRSAEAVKHVEVGEVSETFLKQNLNIDIAINPKAITVIFTNNMGAERIPMTGWTMAHRLGHAIKNTHEWKILKQEFDNNLKEIAEDLYKFKGNDTRQIFKLIALSIGTMRSVRNKTLLNYNEFLYELFAQFLLTGSIKFNPLSQQLIQSYAWGRPSKTYWAGKTETDEYNYVLNNFKNTLEYYFDQCLGGLVGKIFVM
jgi:hypothetical protein